MNKDLEKVYQTISEKNEKYSKIMKIAIPVTTPLIILLFIFVGIGSLIPSEWIPSPDWLDNKILSYHNRTNAFFEGIIPDSLKKVPFLNLPTYRNIPINPTIGLIIGIIFIPILIIYFLLYYAETNFTLINDEQIILLLGSTLIHLENSIEEYNENDIELCKKQIMQIIDNIKRKWIFSTGGLPYAIMSIKITPLITTFQNKLTELDDTANLLPIYNFLNNFGNFILKPSIDSLNQLTLEQDVQIPSFTFSPTIRKSFIMDLFQDARIRNLIIMGIFCMGGSLIVYLLGVYGLKISVEGAYTTSVGFWVALYALYLHWQARKIFR